METPWGQAGKVCRESCIGCPLLEQDVAVGWAAAGLVKAIENWRNDLFDGGDPVEIRQAIQDEVSVGSETDRRRFTPEVQNLAAAVILHNCTSRTKRIHKKETING